MFFFWIKFVYFSWLIYILLVFKVVFNHFWCNTESTWRNWLVNFWNTYPLALGVYIVLLFYCCHIFIHFFFIHWLVRFSRFWRAFDPKYVRCLLLGNLFQSPEEERKLAKERILWMFECLQFVVFSCFWLVWKSYVWRTLCWCFSIFVLKQNSSS